MRVLSSSLALAAQSTHVVEETHSESLQTWGARPGPPPTQPAPLRALPQDAVSASDGHSLDAREGARRLLVERLLVGHRIETAADAPGPDERTSRVPATLETELGDARRAVEGQGPGARYERLDRLVETEGYRFEGRGVVKLADGRLLNVAVDLAQSRQTVAETRTQVQVGAPLKDPLVVNLGAGPATLTAERTRFDLDADGTLDTISTLGGGQAFLALDRNGNGRIDDGRELFGPTTGSGYGELAALDGDGNGWIDEGDAAWARLSLFRPDTGATTSLSAAGVGALSTRAVETAFSLTGGRIAQTGLYLREDGTAGTVQHVDLEA